MESGIKAVNERHTGNQLLGITRDNITDLLLLSPSSGTNSDLSDLTSIPWDCFTFEYEIFVLDEENKKIRLSLRAKEVSCVSPSWIEFASIVVLPCVILIFYLHDRSWTTSTKTK